MNQELIKKLHDWLGKDGRHYFRTLHKLYGTVIPVIKVKIGRKLIGPRCYVPHPVHLREGMQVRNFLRGLDECANWTHDQFENDYVSYIEEAMKEN